MNLNLPTNFGNNVVLLLLNMQFYTRLVWIDAVFSTSKKLETEAKKERILPLSWNFKISFFFLTLSLLDDACRLLIFLVRTIIMYEKWFSSGKFPLMYIMRPVEYTMNEKVTWKFNFENIRKQKWLVQQNVQQKCVFVLLLKVWWHCGRCISPHTHSNSSFISFLQCKREKKYCFQTFFFWLIEKWS